MHHYCLFQEFARIGVSGGRLLVLSELTCKNVRMDS
jgi:hypothetical protein